MLNDSNRSAGLFALAAILALAANAVLYFRMSVRLDALESVSQMHGTSAQGTSPTVDDAVTGIDPPTALANPHATHGTVTQLAPEELVQRLSQRNSGDPAKASSDMSRLMQQEPNLPALESQQNQWLESAFGKMPTDGPTPSNVQSSCRGRRCVVSATFSEADKAQDWADSYLLVAGGKMLQRSRTIVVPAANGSAKLLLYFY